MRGRALLSTVVLLVSCTSASGPPDRGRLVVTGEEGVVHLIDPGDGDRETLEEGGGHAGPVQPTASPGGEVVVWTTVVDERPLIRIHEDGSAREVEVPIVPFYYSFDAGGDTLAALGNDPDGAGIALVLVDLSRDDARIVDFDRPYYLDWHPDESHLAVHVGFRELALFEDGERSALPVLTGDFQAPAWTEDGRLVALLRSEGAAVSRAAQTDGEVLAAVDVSDGSTTVVAEAVGPVPFDVAGRRIAYVEGGAGPLTVVGLDGDGAVEVSSDVVVAFEWSPDGDLLLFHTLEAEAELVPHVWDGEETAAYPSFHPTGLFVARYLPFWSQYARSMTQWAPDGSAFAYAESGDEPTVWVQPLEGERREAGPGLMVTWSG